jgi:hypothetical protein
MKRSIPFAVVAILLLVFVGSPAWHQ